MCSSFINHDLQDLIDALSQAELSAEWLLEDCKKNTELKNFALSMQNNIKVLLTQTTEMFKEHNKC